MWRHNVRKRQQLARVTAHIQQLGLYRRVSRAFRHWRVLEREYCAWHRGFAASYEIGERKLQKRVCRKLVAAVVSSWLGVLARKRCRMGTERQLSQQMDACRMRRVVVRLQRLVERGRRQSVQSLMAADHALSLQVRRAWKPWQSLWQDKMDTFAAGYLRVPWAPLDSRPTKGIGAVVSKPEGASEYTLKTLIDSGAAARSGKFQVGDVIEAINDTRVRALEFEQVKSLIAGPEGLPLVIHASRLVQGRLHKFSCKLYRGEKIYLVPTEALPIRPKPKGAPWGASDALEAEDGDGSSMERALESLVLKQQRWLAMQAVFEVWGQWHLDKLRLINIQKECQIARLRGAVRHLRSTTCTMMSEQRQCQASQAQSERFRRARLRFCMLRLLSRWQSLAYRNRLGDDVIQRCLLPRTLFQTTRNEDQLAVAFGAFVCYHLRQVQTAALLQASERRFDKLRLREGLRNWRKVARAQRGAECRRQRLAASSARRVQRHVYSRMTSCLQAWACFVSTQRRVARKVTYLRTRGELAGKAQAFLLWERQFRSNFVRKQVTQLFHAECEAMKVELEVLQREVEESRLAREHTENELFHTQEALNKAMMSSRKLEDHRHAADEDLYIKLEQYRLETTRAQTTLAQSQAEVLHLRSSLRQVLEESSSENEKHVLARDFLTQRSLAAEEALHALRCSLPLLGGHGVHLQDSDRGERDEEGGGDSDHGGGGDVRSRERQEASSSSPSPLPLSLGAGSNPVFGDDDRRGGRGGGGPVWERGGVRKVSGVEEEEDEFDNEEEEDVAVEGHVLREQRRRSIETKIQRLMR
jgi:hypothetical protein